MMPRFRFKLRGIMLFVAIAGIACFLGLLVRRRMYCLERAGYYASREGILTDGLKNDIGAVMQARSDIARAKDRLAWSSRLAARGHKVNDAIASGEKLMASDRLTLEKAKITLMNADKEAAWSRKQVEAAHRQWVRFERGARYPWLPVAPTFQ